MFLYVSDFGGVRGLARHGEDGVCSTMKRVVKATWDGYVKSEVPDVERVGIYLPGVLVFRGVIL